MEDYKQKYLLLLLKVKSARQAQKNYYAEKNPDRKKHYLVQSKHFEKQLDEEIKGHEQPQLRLS